MIKLEHVTKTYNGKKALVDVNLGIGPGEFVSIVGPSGAGKSTVVRLIIAEEKPTEGKIQIAGRNIARLSHRELPYYRRRIGVVFQDFKLLPQQTIEENIAFALEASDASDEDVRIRVPKILSLVGLRDRAQSYPRQLSGGEKQRVAIARAMIHAPKILIADEPTGNLDPVNTWEIVDLLLRINSRGTTVLLATHNKSVVDRIKKRVIALKGGKIVSDQKEGKYVM